MEVTHLLFYAALSVIALLGIVAVYYQIKLAKTRVAALQREEALKSAEHEQREYKVNSIKILARALIADQVTLTEASIRISVLLESLKPEEPVRKQLSVFYQLAEACSHIPILDQWKVLSKKEKRQYEKERLQIEKKYQDFVYQAARKISTGEMIIR